MADSDRKLDDSEELAEGTLVSHLIELRQRLMKAVLSIVVIFLCLLPFANRIWTIVTEPLNSVLPEDSTAISTDIIAPFLTPLKATFYVALCFAMPVILYQIWHFVAPGLYRRERRFAVPLVVSSILLFYAGVAFAYFVVFGMVFAFIIKMVPESVTWMPDINRILSFALRMCFSFGIAFEIPIATFMLIWSRLVSIEVLRKQRPYVFLGCFVVGMFLTPPDAISQTMLAVPMYLLYECGLILASILLRDEIKAASEARARAASEDAP
jgi:sec-independent protein translocase protein TatC